METRSRMVLDPIRKNVNMCFWISEIVSFHLRYIIKNCHQRSTGASFLTIAPALDLHAKLAIEETEGRGGGAWKKNIVWEQAWRPTSESLPINYAKIRVYRACFVKIWKAQARIPCLIWNIQDGCQNGIKLISLAAIEKFSVSAFTWTIKVVTIINFKAL